MATNQGFANLIPYGGISAFYLAYCLMYYVEDIKALASGTTYLEVSKSKLRTFRIPLSPSAEQERIVAEIAKQFTRLDSGVAALARVHSRLKNYRASLLKVACEGRLVSTEVELARAQSRSYEPAAVLLHRILSERRERWIGKHPYKEPDDPEITDFSGLPEGWCWASVEQVVFLDVGYAFKSSEFTKDGLRLLRGENIEPGALRWHDVRFWPRDKLGQFRSLLVQDGDIILAMDRPLISSGLKIARARKEDLPCLLVQRMARFRPVESGMTGYLYTCLRTQLFIRHLLGGQTGTQLPHISGRSILSFTFPLPPLAEQQRIAMEVDRRCSVVDQLEEELTVSLKRAERLRQSILRDAFNGRLVPQDPGDEPVSMLLRRILDERAGRNRPKRAAS
jgi:type I restriction enzyme S subunit